MKGQWIKARFVSRCMGCDRMIQEGDRAWWYRFQKLIYCHECGEAPSMREAGRKMDKNPERYKRRY